MESCFSQSRLTEITVCTGYICRYASWIWITREHSHCSIMHSENNNMKHKWFQGWCPRRECRQDLNLQQWDILSRSLNALMIVRDSFSANMYSEVNKNVLLMLQAHLKGICNYFKVAYHKSGWCASWLLRTCGHLSKTVLYSHNHPLLCSFRWGSYLSASYGKIYICLRDRPIFCKAGYVRKTI